MDLNKKYRFGVIGSLTCISYFYFLNLNRPKEKKICTVVQTENSYVQRIGQGSYLLKLSWIQLFPDRATFVVIQTIDKTIVLSNMIKSKF